MDRRKVGRIISIDLRIIPQSLSDSRAISQTALINPHFPPVVCAAKKKKKVVVVCSVQQKPELMSTCRAAAVTSPNR